jgi:hypothetical protein
MRHEQNEKLLYFWMKRFLNMFVLKIDSSVSLCPRQFCVPNSLALLYWLMTTFGYFCTAFVFPYILYLCVSHLPLKAKRFFFANFIDFKTWVCYGQNDQQIFWSELFETFEDNSKLIFFYKISFWNLTMQNLEITNEVFSFWFFFESFFSDAFLMIFL